MTYNLTQRQTEIYSDNLQADEEIPDLDEILDEVKLQKPHDRYSWFVKREYEKHNYSWKGKSVRDFNNSRIISEKFAKLTEKEKEKLYIDIEEQKLKFKQDCNIMKKYFLTYNIESITPYQTFLNVRLNEAFEKQKDPIEAKKEAKEEWENMDSAKKSYWNDVKKDNDKLWRETRNLKTINSYSIFLKDKFLKSKNKLTFQEAVEMWQKITPKELKDYKNKAIQINESRQKMRDIYEIVHGIKPIKPKRAINMFIKDYSIYRKFNEKDGQNPPKTGTIAWQELDKVTKEEYLKKYKKLALCYKYKLIIYNKRLNKVRYNKGFQIFMRSLEGQKNQLKSGQSLFEYAVEKWKTLAPEKVKEFCKMGHKYKASVAEMKKDQLDKEPEKELSSFSLFFKENFPVLKNENPDKKNIEIAQIIGKKWNSLSDQQKKKYITMPDKANERYKKEKNEFKEYMNSQVNATFIEKDETSQSTAIKQSKETAIKKCQGRPHERGISQKMYQKAWGSQRGRRETSRIRKNDF